LTGLAETVEPFATVSISLFLLVPKGAELLAAEEILVTGDDRGLLRDLLLADPDRAPFFGPLEEVPLQLFLELSGATHRGGGHRENSIGRSAPGAKPGCGSSR